MLTKTVHWEANDIKVAPVDGLDEALTQPLYAVPPRLVPGWSRTNVLSLSSV